MILESSWLIWYSILSDGMPDKPASFFAGSGNSFGHERNRSPIIVFRDFSAYHLGTLHSSCCNTLNNESNIELP